MKKILAIIFAAIVMMVPAFNSFAATNNPPFKIGAVMINQETGEKTPVAVDYTVNPTSTHLFSEAGDESYVAKVTADFKLPKSESQPFITDTSSTESDVKATIAINYDRMDDQIRVNKVFGSWVPSSSQIFINNREVDYGDGVPFGKSAHKHPTSNSYSYTTGWGWVQRYPASSEALTGARAFSSATVGVSGMAPHTIEVLVTANQ